MRCVEPVKDIGAAATMRSDASVPSRPGRPGASAAAASASPWRMPTSARSWTHRRSERVFWLTGSISVILLIFDLQLPLRREVR